MDKVRKISVVAAVLVSSAFIMNHFFIVLPNQRDKELLSKQFESVSPKNEIISEENVSDEMQNEEQAETADLIDFESFNKKVNEQKGYVANPNDNNADNQSSDFKKVSKQTEREDKKYQQDIADAKLEIDKAETKIQQEIDITKKEADKKVQESFLAKLEADKALYDSKMKMLYLDCEHQYDSIESRERDEILQTKSMFIFSYGHETCDEQCEQYVDRVKDKYESEYTYLANTCEVNMELIEATKYW